MRNYTKSYIKGVHRQCESFKCNNRYNATYKSANGLCVSCNKKFKRLNKLENKNSK